MNQKNDISFTVFGATDVGLIRSQNQDSYLVADLELESPLVDNSTRRFSAKNDDLTERLIGAKGGLFAVADGMGGAAAGDVASQLGLDTLFAELLKRMNNSMRKNLSAVDTLKVCVEKSNRRLWEESQMNIDFRGMGTTLTAALVYGPTAYIAEVGDSRAYLLRSEGIEQVTKDQSAVQALIDLGRMTKEEAMTAPNRNIILQALGVEPTVQVALTRVSLRRGDYLLICSDGLSNKVDEGDLRNIVLSPNQIDSACRNLIELANIRGGEDNITVVLARFDGEGLPAPSDNEPISKTVEVISEYCLAEARRELHTSQLVLPDQLRVEG